MIKVPQNLSDLQRARGHSLVHHSQRSGSHASAKSCHAGHAGYRFRWLSFSERLGAGNLRSYENVRKYVRAAFFRAFFIFCALIRTGEKAR